ncbi:hypothetical protein SD77_0305 [Bacillus badius]|uniref:Uncharacterized protein n=1 Tax=Bacillus badius TaxID=1455 RepID=A0ABR5B0I1_BACBA|nr:hypothetical protein SD78_3636 [Bacillus badius]KIL80457.1 hypothetical protein SD77_0305 [Bacillus badius]
MEKISLFHFIPLQEMCFSTIIMYGAIEKKRGKILEAR